LDTRVEDKPIAKPLEPAEPSQHLPTRQIGRASPSLAKTGALALSPLNRRRWRNFKANRRGYYSLWVFLILFAVTLFAEFIANDRPYYVSFEGRSFFPVVFNYPETAFGGDFETAADYRDPFLQKLISERKLGEASARATRIVSDAEGYANDLVPKARGQAQQMLEESEAYRQRKINEATGDAARFNQVAAEYSKAAQVTSRRLYLETMEQVLPRIAARRPPSVRSARRRKSGTGSVTR